MPPSGSSKPLTQDSQPLAISTPLGKDAMLLTGFTGLERMSSLFSFELELASEREEIDPSSLVGKPVSFRIVRHDGRQRHFHGHVSRLAFRGVQLRHALWEATVVPWFWFLTQTTDCRIFQDQTVRQIAERIFEEMGFHEFEFDLREPHARRPYCVQYRETDHAFLTRLFEEEGMFHYFRHEQDRHVLVVADHAGAYGKASETGIGMSSKVGVGDLSDLITKWGRQFSFHPGKLASTDYNPDTPSLSLRTSEGANVPLRGVERYEVFEFPGRFADTAEAKLAAKRRAEELAERFDTASGEGMCRTFSPGMAFTMERHHAKAERGRSWVATEVVHDARAGATYVTGGELNDVTYRNRFTCVPATRAFRPPRVTQRPTIHGCQTAIVVGPRGARLEPGHEVHVDDQGRVKVRFHWDRYAKEDDRSSCWIRVSQAWAGAGMGGINIPRIGQEVVVSFVEGDPDRPLITGRVYNGERMPYASTAGQSELKRMREKNRSLKSSASKAAAPASVHAPDDAPPQAASLPQEGARRGDAVLTAMRQAIPAEVKGLARRGSANPPSEADGQPLSSTFMMTSFRSESLDGAGGSNEITMNDAGGSEGLFFKAQKDEVHTVGNDQTQSVGNDQVDEVGNDRSATVGNDDTLSVGANRVVTVGESQNVTVGKSKSEKVAMMSSEMVGVMKSTTVGGAFAVTVGGGHTVTVGGMMNTAVGLMSFEQVGINKSITVGSKIEIVCGASKLTMDAAGNITLEGVNITVKGSTAIRQESGGTFDCTAAGQFAASAGQKMTLKAGAGMKIDGGPTVDVDGGVIDLN